MTTLTPFVDMAPVPRVLIDVPTAEFPAGSVTVSLRRTSEGRTMDVRGGQRLPASSPAIVLDPEAGFQVDSSYTVVGYDASGDEIGTWPLGSTVVDFDGTVVQQPLDPRLAVVVTRLIKTAAETTRETPGELAYPQGEGIPGLVGLGPRRGLQDVGLELFVSTFEEADKLQESLGTYGPSQLPIWLIRTPPGQRIPRVFFCHVPRLVESSVLGSEANEYVRFSATVTEVRPPAAGITAAALTHSDMKVFFSTHTGVKARYGTHSDVKRDTSLIGAADA